MSCSHKEIEPYGDGNWGKCKLCGDDGFPMTAEAAGQCSYCGAYCGYHKNGCPLEVQVEHQGLCSWATGKHDEPCDLVAGLQAELDDKIDPLIAYRLRTLGEKVSVLQEQLNDKNAPLMKALDDIAELCGCAHWDYAGQVVRDVELLKERCQKLEEALWDARGGKQPGCVCDPADLYICDGIIDRCRGEEKKS